jgi:hypothetical protein
MPRYAGRRGVVYVSTTGTGNAVLVASLNNWSLDMTTDKLEVTAFGDANKTYVIGLKDISGSFSGFYDTAETTVWSGVDSADGVKMYLYPSSDAPSKYAYGPAWLDMSIAVGVGDAVTVNGTFSSNGSWGNRLGT